MTGLTQDPTLLGLYYASETRLFELVWHGEATDPLLSSLVVEAFVGVEALQQYSEFSLLLLSTSAHLPLSNALYQRVSLDISLSDGKRTRVSGLIRQAVLLGSEGGFARYRFQMVSWLWLLTQRQQSRVWQDKTLIEIIDTLLEEYPFAKWRWSEEVNAFMSSVRPRSYCVQYRESDYDFMLRILTEEGIGFRIEEGGTNDIAERAESGARNKKASLGEHRLVFFSDTTQAERVPEDITSQSQLGGVGIRFHGGRSRELQDSIQHLSAIRQLNPAISTVLSYDYKQKRVVAASSETNHRFGGEHAPRLEAYDPTSLYTYFNIQEAERYATLHQQCYEVRNKQWQGKSTVRSLRPGTRFTLTQAPIQLNHYAGDKHAPIMLVLKVSSIGINNLPKAVEESITELMGGAEDWLQEACLQLREGQHIDWREQSTQTLSLAWQDETIPIDDISQQLMGSAIRSEAGTATRLQPDIKLAKTLGYANVFAMVRQDIPWRPLQVDSNGVRKNVKPTAPGSQTALVIGPTVQGREQYQDVKQEEQEIYQDRLGRIRILFHWQKSYLGSAKMPINENASCWVRVAQRSAVGGMGAQFIPRVGQEVFVQFLEGDIDRPIVLGALYNGQGEGGVVPTLGGQAPNSDDQDRYLQALDHHVSAQANRVDGNSPVWHGASADAQGHHNPAAITGIRSKELNATGYNQLLFDDTPQQGRTQLKTTQAGTELNLGHLIHQADNYRGSFRGQGAELRTDAYGTLRAGSGYLITSYRYRVSQHQRDFIHDNVPGIAHLNNTLNLATALNQAAHIHQTVRYSMCLGTEETDTSYLSGKGSTSPQAPLAALLTAASGMVNGQQFSQAQQDAQAKCTRVTSNTVPHTTDPLLHIVGEAGIVMTAQDHLQLSSQEHLHISAGGDQQWITANSTSLHSGQAIGLLAGANQAGPGNVGIQLKAAQGNIQLETHQDAIHLAADGLIDIMSSHAHIDWAAAKKITLCVEGGASITLENGRIQLTCPGQLTIHAKKKEFLSGGRVSYRLPVMPKSVCKACLLSARASGSPFAKR